MTEVIDDKMEKPIADDPVKEGKLDSDSEADDCGDDDSDDEKPEKLSRGEMYEVKNAVEYLDRSWVTFSIFFGLYYIL